MRNDMHRDRLLSTYIMERDHFIASSSIVILQSALSILQQSNSEHVSGAGAENGAEQVRKWDERDLKKIRWSGSGSFAVAERSGERAKSAAHNPLKPQT